MIQDIGRENKARGPQPEKGASSTPSTTARLHLRVLPDESGGESLCLNAALFEHEWQNKVASGAANTAFGLLRESTNLQQVLKTAESLVNEGSRLADHFFEQASGAIECRAGCDHCCHQPVGATPPEAIQIYTFLQQNRSEDELQALGQGLRERSVAIRGLSPSDRFSPNHPCPLLKEGSCSVYPARPLACRGMNSSDRADCDSRLHDPVRREEFLRTGQGGRVLLNPLRATQAISAGMQIALFEQFHLDMRHLDLIWALDLLFTRGLTVAEEWLAGKEAFQSALGAQE